MARTETATIVPSSWKTWVMPTLRPMSPMLIAATRPIRALAPARAHSRTSVRLLACSSPPSPGPAGQRCQRWSRSSHLDLDVDPSGEAESHQGVHGLRARIQDVDEPLVGADLELLAGVFVDERGAQ